MEASESWSESQKENNLRQVFHVWQVRKGDKQDSMSTNSLHKAFRILMKGRVSVLSVGLFALIPCFLEVIEHVHCGVVDAQYKYYYMGYIY